MNTAMMTQNWEARDQQLHPNALLLWPLALKRDLVLNHVIDQSLVDDLGLYRFKRDPIGPLAANNQPIDLHRADLVSIHQS